MRLPESKYVPFSRLAELADRLHAEGKKIVTTNGCFDLLHWGHVKYLSEARSLGDVLVVGVNSDRSVKKLKGESRPLNAEDARALTLAALESVDYVAIFDEDTPLRFLELVRPAIHAKGGDYDGRPLPESSLVERMGGQLRLIPFVPGHSTTQTIAKMERDRASANLEMFTEK